MRINTDDYIVDKSHLLEEAKDWYHRLNSESMEYTGWVDLPAGIDHELVDDITATAEHIKSQCSMFIVVGIGGSYLGAKAVIDALNGSMTDCPDIQFAGYSMSAAYQEKLIRRMNSESTCLCVVSKSGRTVEPMLSYAILKDRMFAKYGIEEARKRIYVITDENKGDLRIDAFENQFKTFSIPENIGGRYSVLTPAGLLPIAAAGHDIINLLGGAKSLMDKRLWEESLLDYATSRVALQKAGKCVEVFEYFEANLTVFGDWLQQLFGESEGKEGKGAFPACLCFSRDLHSMGQFLQQGNQIFYETIIRIKESAFDLDIPCQAGYPYAGKTIEQINECSESGVIAAHRKAGIPLGIIEVDKLDEYSVGQLIYFFEMSAAVSAFLLGLNPFDQPGVEFYKQEMKDLVLKL